ncbi:MAG: bifunctional molybdopterin-guanine dinucleotide biosynthesis adaptor protein MobB/molybdopterin molybdotransferase MoeA [Gammaproteobacteria bacterium]|nr:bifunctional molybdopterin-guanine dinucleotide biosynthesis adaptor protein MobB/molybdopterin molybdotransferase MoeA [Gammaproteobacteria bacterium]
MSPNPLGSPTPLLGFAAWSGTGKTTLLLQLIPLLKSRGIRVAAIKHTHHNFDIDQPGKDSYALRKSGADQLLVASAQRWALMTETRERQQEPNLIQLLPQLDHTQLDLILIEGFKHEAIPRIELYRSPIGKPLLYPDDPQIIAIALTATESIQPTIPRLDLDNSSQIADFIQTQLKPQQEPITMDTPKQPLLPFNQAQEQIFQQITPTRETESIRIKEALGRTLGEEIISPIDVPAYDNSAMDGYALRGEDLPTGGSATLEVIGSSFAGTPFEGRVGAGQSVRIMTGAKIPSGADTVIMQEKARREGEQVTFSSEDNHKAGENVRMAGEDMGEGEAVLQPGQPLGAAELGMIASLGYSSVQVKKRIRVAFFSTGDELCSAGEPLGDGQIYDSNRYTVFSLLSELGVELIDLGIIRDQRELIEQAFHDAAAEADVVITSGGVSVGEADFVKETLDKLGEINFWRIAMKPGKPLAFGKLDGAWFFGLPGNPVSAMVTFMQFVRPALNHLAGKERISPFRIPLRCSNRLKKRPGRLEFQRGIMEQNEQGETVVRGAGHQGSHILRSMSLADCFIVLPEENGGVEAGDWVEVEPF